MKLVQTVAPYYKDIQNPIYIVQGKLDGIVPYHTAQFLYDQLTSQDKHLYLSDNGKHHICFCEDCDAWFSQALQFLQRH